MSDIRTSEAFDAWLDSRLRELRLAPLEEPLPQCILDVLPQDLREELQGGTGPGQAGAAAR